MTTPFTDDERSAIRNYLGWSELFKDLDTRLETQLDMIPLRSPSGATLVRARLVLLVAIDTKIQDAALNNLDVKQVDEVQMLGPDQLEALRETGRTYVNQIATVFELTPKRDYFTGGALGGVLDVG